MKEIAIIRGGLAAALSIAAAACSTGLENKTDLGVRPFTQQDGENVSPDAVFYQDAVNAIDHRDYATALDYLQAARAKDPKNVRVLNAFGVVYDKLGRFDLSAHYYAEASALDPGSTTIARNIAYSRTLQGLMGPQVATVEPSAAQPPVQSARLSAMPAEAGAPPIAAPTIPVTVQPAPAITPATHVAPTLDTSVPSAPGFTPSMLTFAGVKLDLPDEPDVHVASLPKAEPPAKLSPDAVKVVFDNPRAQVLAMQPVRVEPSALTVLAQTAQQPKEVAPISQRAVSFEKVAISIPDLPSALVFDVTAPTVDPRLVVEVPPAVVQRIATQAPFSPEKASAEISATNPSMPTVYRAAIAPVLANPVTGESLAAFSTAARVQHPVASTAQPTPTLAPSAKQALLIGRPLRIVDASGRQGATDPVHRSLAALGWSVSKLRPTSVTALKYTTVIYPLVNEPVAQALARTLPFPARLTLDACGCHGVQLVVGSDFLTWKATGRRVPNIWRANLNFAALSAKMGVQ